MEVLCTQQHSGTKEHLDQPSRDAWQTVCNEIQQTLS